WRSEASKLFDVPPQAFTPPPKVTSSIVHIVPRQSPLPCEIGNLEKVTRAAFGQRRKMLRASLKSLGGEDLLNLAGIEATKRAEEISVEGFVALANALQDFRN
ncbi:MAG: rRNA adenine N-6-methyltransferase family protein, partial [Pseudomonadota bacterium]